MNKTYKALAKRVKVTKNGKVLKRKAGQDHFNTRESGKVTRNKRRDIQINSFKKLATENL
mgnify:CR=1 FL=1